MTTYLIILKILFQTSGQVGGIGRYTLLPLTTKRRTTKNNENCQKIELYGSLTNKELKKKHSFRLVGEVEMGSRYREYARQDGGWQTGWSHICVRIIWEEQLGSETDHTTQGSNMGKESLKTSGCKILWGLWWRKKLPTSQESLLEKHTGSQNVHKHAHPGISTRKTQFACGQQRK